MKERSNTILKKSQASKTRFMFTEFSLHIVKHIKRASLYNYLKDEIKHELNVAV